MKSLYFCHRYQAIFMRFTITIISVSLLYSVKAAYQHCFKHRQINTVWSNHYQHSDPSSNTKDILLSLNHHAWRRVDSGQFEKGAEPSDKCKVTISHKECTAKSRGSRIRNSCVLQQQICTIQNRWSYSSYIVLLLLNTKWEV